MNVAVIGGGISGLTVAYRLKKSGVGVTLFEAGTTVGGNIKTETRDGFLFELGPNSLLASRHIYDLVDDLHLLDEIEPPKQQAKKRFIVRDGRMVALPSGLATLLTTGAFSFGAKLRLLKEPFINSRSSEGETVAKFFERRLGREVVEYAVDPFISGIYAGDPDQLAIKTSFPVIHKYEAEYGGIIRGMLFSPSDKAAKLPKDVPRSFTLKNGVAVLTNALGDYLGESVRLRTQVTSISKNGESGYRLDSDIGAAFVFDSVVVSTPASSASSLVAKIDDNLANELSGIYYAPITVAFAAFKCDQVGIEPDGFGVLVPSVERRRILGCLFTSSVFGNRAPEGYHLFTIFIGGSRNADLCSNSETDLLRIGIDEIRSLLKIEGEPAFTEVKKWEKAIPQYNVGYESVVAAIDRVEADTPGIFFCSNFYKGISVGDCVKNANATAEEILKFLNR